MIAPRISPAIARDRVRLVAFIDFARHLFELAHAYALNPYHCAQYDGGPYAWSHRAGVLSLHWHNSAIASGPAVFASVDAYRDLAGLADRGSVAQ